MSRFIKEESLIIDQMFSWCASVDDLFIIKKSLNDVRKGEGLYSEIVKRNGDLHSLKFSVADYTGLDIKVSGELARVLWHIVKPTSERKRMISTSIVYGIWKYADSICVHTSHARLNGEKFPLKKGAKIGIFKRIYPQQLVGCGCFITPVFPF